MNQFNVTAATVVLQLLDEAVLVADRSVITDAFHRDFERLPPEVKITCHEKFRRWRENPETLNFEPKFANLFGVEIDHRYHAVCQRVSEPAPRPVAKGALPAKSVSTVKWIFVGDYKTYTKLLDSYR